MRSGILAALAVGQESIAMPLENPRKAAPIARLSDYTPANTLEPQPTPESADLPTISKAQLKAMPDGQLILCPSHPDGVTFSKKHNAWGFVRVVQIPKYFALYVSHPFSDIHYVGEIEMWARLKTL